MQEGPSTRVLGPFLFFFLRPVSRSEQPTRPASHLAMPDLANIDDGGEYRAD